METRNSNEHCETWGSKVEYYLACLGSVYFIRLPILCYYYGGVAYLIPFTLMLVLFGIPMLYMELAIGQLVRFGPVKAMSKLCPLLKGTGVAMVFLSVYGSGSNILLIALALYYFFNSFSNPQPWKLCSNSWNSHTCVSGHENYSISQIDNDFGQFWGLLDSMPAEEYFDRRVMQQNVQFDGLGGMRLELAGCLCFSWFICYFCVFKGVRFIGKVSYVTTAMQYLFTIVLLVKFLTLPGAVDGIKSIKILDWSKFKNPSAWISVLSQSVFFLDVGKGRLTYSSYNRKVNNISLDVLCFVIVSLIVSTLGGLLLFSGCGALAHILGLETEEILYHGLFARKVFFVLLPTLLTHFDAPGAWAAILFLMVLCFQLNSQIACIQVLNTALLDTQIWILNKLPYRKALVALFVCFVCLMLTLPYVTQGGEKFLFLVNMSGSTASISVCWFLVMAVWIYGPNRLAREISYLSRYRLPYFVPFCWLFITPVLATVMLVSEEFKHYIRYFDPGLRVLGYLIMFSSLIWVLIGLIHTLVSSNGTCGLRCKKSFTPSFKPTYATVSDRVEESLLPVETYEMEPSDQIQLLEREVGTSSAV